VPVSGFFAYAGFGEAAVFQVYIVIVVDVVYSNYGVTSFQKPFGEVEADEAGGAGDKYFHNVLRAMLFKFPSSQAPREVVPRLLFGVRIFLLLSLLGAGLHEGGTTEVVLCPFFPKKLWKRTSFIFISLGAGIRDPPAGGEAVSWLLHTIMYRTNLSILSSSLL
jgi:hypothetical protein